MKANKKRELERKKARKARKKEIIDAARELFFEKGILETSMVDIASNAEISRYTLYQYFNSKYEILIEVELLLFEEFNNSLNLATEKHKTGIARVRSFLHKLVDYINAEPDFIRFSSTFNQLFFSHKIPDDLQKRFRDSVFNHGDYTFLIQKGIDDGSIRKDIEPQEITILLIEAVFGLVQKLLTTENHPIWGYEGNRLQMMHLHVDILVDYLKA